MTEHEDELSRAYSIIRRQQRTIEGYEKGDIVYPFRANPEGLKAARRTAAHELHDSRWADEILEAYFYPSEANSYLDGEGA